MGLFLEIVVSVLFKKKTLKNSNNSDLSPSQDFGSNGNRNKRVGKENKINGDRLDNSKDTETSQTVSPRKCTECDTDLKKAKVKSTEER